MSSQPSQAYETSSSTAKVSPIPSKVSDCCFVSSVKFVLALDLSIWNDKSALVCFWGLQNRDFQGLVPVTVKQITESSQSGGEKSGIVINGVELTNVTISYKPSLISPFFCSLFSQYKKFTVIVWMFLAYSGLTCWSSV